QRWRSDTWACGLGPEARTQRTRRYILVMETDMDEISSVQQTPAAAREPSEAHQGSGLVGPRTQTAVLRQQADDETVTAGSVSGDHGESRIDHRCRPGGYQA